MVKKILIIFILWKLLTIIFAYTASIFVPLDTSYTYWFRKYRDMNSVEVIESKIPYFVWIWGNFDGYYYVDIGERGYHLYEQPFFPLYPISINLLTQITKIPYLISGLIISNTAFLLSLFMIGKLLVLDKKTHLSNLLYLAVILFPTSFFYGSAYNDSLFLLLSSCSIYFARKRQFVLSSCIGALATLARLNGLALMFVVFFEFALSKKNHEWNMKKMISAIKQALVPYTILKDKIYAIFLIPLAFIAYLYYVNYTFNNWQLVFTSMRIWGQDRVIFPLQVFFRYFKIIIFHNFSSLTYWVAVFEVSIVCFYIFLMVYSYKRIRFSYWIFFVISILIPSLTGTFAGMPRYGLHVYPFFLMVGLFLEDKGAIVKVIYFVISTIFLFLSLSLFTRGYFIS